MKVLPNKFNSSKGFTLIELLVVIAIIGILAGALFVAINPGQRIRQANEGAAENSVSGYAGKVETYAGDVNGGSGVYPIDPNSPPTGSGLGALPSTGGSAYAYTYQAMTAAGGTTCTETTTTGTCTRFSLRVYPLSKNNLGTSGNFAFIYDSGKGSTCFVSEGSDTAKTCP